MKLKCKINGKIYDIVQGCSFVDNYEETLDSGTIILSQIPKIKDLDPYDDVYIWDSEKIDFKGFKNKEEFKTKKDYEVFSYDFQNDKGEYQLYIKKEDYEEIVNFLLDNYIEKEIQVEGKVQLHPNRLTELEGTAVTLIYNLSLNENNDLVLKSTNYENGIYTLKGPDGRDDEDFELPSQIVFTKKESDSNYCYSETLNYINGLYLTSTTIINFNVFNIETKKTVYQRQKFEGFYKHMLVDQFSYEMLNMVDFKNGNGVNGVEPLYNYPIQLFSEIKAMEKIILPNISITQPLNVNKKKTIYKYIWDFLEMYSPKIKVVDSKENKTWKYEQKYHIATELQEVLDNCYPQDFCLNTPTLRELLTELLKTKDMIPYVADNVVYGLDITKRNGEFKLDLGDINFIVGSKTSDNYANKLRTEYQQALSSTSTCRSVEYVGFRNSSSSLMTLDNMRLELSFPIYKINSVKLCYFNKAELKTLGDTSTKYGYNLIEQDITPLILLNSIRNMLPDDWESVDKTLYELENLEQLAKLKFCTIGYSQGSNVIEGWGNRYTYFKKNLLKWYEPQKTVIENILAAIQTINPLGNVVKYNEIFKNLDENTVLSKNNEHISPFSAKSESFAEGILTRLYQSESGQSSIPLFFKSLLFKVDYEAYYNGTIVHSKAQDEKDDICSSDSQSSSLTLLEKDGLAKIEKLNRFGNTGYQITGRYANKFCNFDYIQPLGSVLNIDSDDDIVIYSREYSIWNNEINVRYSGMKDYVLKNFFTSVFAKYRLYNIMGTEESVRRNENIYTLTMLSKNEQYYEKDIENLYNISTEKFLERTLIPSFEPNVKVGEKGELIVNKNEELNLCYIEINNAKYSCDFLRIVSGHTLAFNLKMFDNASMGTFISVPSPFSKLENEDLGLFKDWEVTNDYTGSKQQWYMTVDDTETGFAENMIFFVGTTDYSKKFNNDIKVVGNEDTTKEVIKEKYESEIFSMPKVNYEEEKSFIKIKKKINKDNKELINMTIENELISKEDDIVISDYLLHLSNLDNNNFIRNDSIEFEYYNEFLSGTYNVEPYITYALDSRRSHSYYSVLEIPTDRYKKVFKKGRKISGKIGDISKKNGLLTYDSVLIGGWEFSFEEISEVTDDYFDIKGKQLVYLRKNSESPYELVETTETIRFRTIETLGREYGIENYYHTNEGSVNYYKNNPFYKTFLFYGRRIKVENLETWGWSSGSPSGYTHYLSDDTCSTSPFVLIRNELFNFTEVDNYFDTPRSTSMLLLPAYNSNNVEKNEKVPKTMFVRLSDSKMSKTIEYEEYKEDDISMSDFKLSDIVKYKKDEEKNNPYLFVDLSSINNLENVKSIQYWYWNINTQSYHFVFGVNVSEEDKVNGFIKIYISILTKKDMRVYDENHNIIGKSMNYAKSSKGFGKEQYYE